MTVDTLAQPIAPSTPGAVRETRSTCCYCGVGCGVVIETRRDANGRDTIVGVRGDPDHPANFGRLCSKGSTLHLTATPERYAQTRATHPELRASRDAARTRVSWDDALEHVAQRLARTVERHGPDSVGFYISGQLLTEDYYVFNKLAKGLVGTNNIDSNSRLCMSSAVVGYKKTLGADAPPCSYEDLDHALTVLIAGANPAYAHPILYRRLEAARARNPQMKVIVADPRRTDSASDATLHLALQPGTDTMLFNAMLHVLIWDGALDSAFIAAHTHGFDALRDAVRDATPAAAAQVCGLRADDIVQAARWFGAGPSLSLYCQGLNQSSSGTAKNVALINLHLATGQIGKPGAGPFSLTGQPNAMGGREVGGMATLASAHRDLANPAERAEIARLWGVPDLPAKPGLTAVEMFERLAEGTLKAIWIVCTNPAHSIPSQALARAGLERAEFVVLQDAYAHTGTAPYADVLLPAATWGEKEGTVTNSERRISRVRAATQPYGDARADWRIAADVGRRLEARLAPGRPTLFPYEDAEAIWNEHRATTLGRDCDIGGLSWPLLARDGPQQWPFPAGATQGLARLYTDGRFPSADGRARFVPTPYQPVAEAVDARYRFALTTGRLRDQWHGGSRTGSVAKLFAHAPQPCVELNPGDCARLGLGAHDFVHLTSRRGSALMPARADDAVAPGQAFAPMHWGDEYVSGVAGNRAAMGINALTTPARDPHSQQPELKHAAIKLLKADLPWRWLIAARVPPGELLARQRAARAFFARFPYASCVPFGTDAYAGLAWRAAAYEPAPAELQREIEALFELPAQAADVMSYGDARRGTGRRVRIVDGALVAFSVAGAAGATEDSAAVLRDYVDTGASVGALGRLLLFAGRVPLQTAPTRGRTICNCVGVSEREIGAVLAADAPSAAPVERLANLQERLKCGTQCGSCIPELRRLIAETATAAAPPPR
ncbi:nitrate reductase [Burkholderia pseudomallei]|uniref:nitrate reductase n=1 Tax=Burkholderia pseudomallei TaxID=28450 RepID=UPI000975527C|nr:nitrate reductase [Burkholderia pseudomallei]OMW47626.1 nitrate reductase [Burkholderia pseudomallei]